MMTSRDIGQKILSHENQSTQKNGNFKVVHFVLKLIIKARAFDYNNKK